MLSLPQDTAVVLPAQLPEPRRFEMSDKGILSRAAKQNPELRALALEGQGQRDSVRLARLQRLSDFSLAAGGDLPGIGQSLSGMITVPLLRHEAISASIAQAQARLLSAV
jgi:outer membrane protein TolC